MSENRAMNRCHCEYNKVLRKAQTTHFKSSDTAVIDSDLYKYCNNHLCNERPSSAALTVTEIRECKSHWDIKKTAHSATMEILPTT